MKCHIHTSINPDGAGATSSRDPLSIRTHIMSARGRANNMSTAYVEKPHLRPKGHYLHILCWEWATGPIWKVCAACRFCRTPLPDSIHAEREKEHTHASREQADFFRASERERERLAVSLSLSLSLSPLSLNAHAKATKCPQSITP